MIGPLPEAAHMGGGRQDHGPAHAEMGKQHLPEIAVNFLVILIDPHRRVAQAQPLQAAAQLPCRAQRHQGPCGLYDGVSGGPGQPVAVPGAAGQRIAHAAGGHNNAGRLIVRLLPLDAPEPAVPEQQRLGPVPHDLHLQPAQVFLQRAADVKGPVRYREHPVPPLRLQRHAQALEKVHHVPAAEPGEGAVQKPPAAGHILQEFLQAAAVGHVAPALAGNIQLFAQPLIGLQQHCPPAVFRRRAGGHHSGGPAANHNNIMDHQTPRTHPKSPPGG